MAATTPIERRLERLERKIDLLLKEKGAAKATWVKASVIADLTGWDKEGLRKARNYGYVEHRKENGKFLYNLDSLNERMIKKPATA